LSNYLKIFLVFAQVLKAQKKIPRFCVIKWGIFEVRDAAYYFADRIK